MHIIELHLNTLHPFNSYLIINGFHGNNHEWFHVVHIPPVSNNNGQLNCYMLLINDPSLPIQWPVDQVDWNMLSPSGTSSTFQFSILWAGLCHCCSVVADFCHFWGQMTKFFYILWYRESTFSWVIFPSQVFPQFSFA